MRHSIRALLLVAILAAMTLGAAATGSPAAPEESKKIVFVHGPASHGYGGHAYGAAFRMLARILNEKKTPTLEELEADLGVPGPQGFNADAVREMTEAMNP